MKKAAARTEAPDNREYVTLRSGTCFGSSRQIVSNTASVIAVRIMANTTFLIRGASNQALRTTHEVGMLWLERQKLFHGQRPRIFPKSEREDI
jgi:hypothetical protein